MALCRLANRGASGWTVYSRRFNWSQIHWITRNEVQKRHLLTLCVLDFTLWLFIGEISEFQVQLCFEVGSWLSVSLGTRSNWILTLTNRCLHAIEQDHASRSQSIIDRHTELWSVICSDFHHNHNFRSYRSRSKRHILIRRCSDLEQRLVVVGRTRGGSKVWAVIEPLNACWFLDLNDSVLYSLLN